MPNYTYTDENGHINVTFHRMNENPEIICAACGLEMWRKPSNIVGVNWGGIPPSQGEIHPKTKEFLDGVPERREKFLQEHEEHEKRTAGENDE